MDISGILTARMIDNGKSATTRPAPAKGDGAATGTTDSSTATSARASVPPAILADLADKARSVLNAVNLDIEFSVDKASGDTVIRVMDLETSKVIRQIPSEEMLVLSQALEKMQGALVKNKA